MNEFQRSRTAKLRILIADDHSMIREGVRSVIESQKGWELCGQADNGRTALALAQKLKPDVALLDIGMPGLNGVEVTRLIAKRTPGTKVLILTMLESEIVVDDALEAGARGYLLKSDASELLPRAIETVMAGKIFLTRKMSDLAQPVPDKPGVVRIKSRLSPREREIVQLLAEGKMNKEVAGMLTISVATVETHRKNILGKLHLHCTADLVRYAIRSGLAQA